MSKYIVNPEPIRTGLIAEYKKETCAPTFGWMDTTTNKTDLFGSAPAFPVLDGVIDSFESMVPTNLMLGPNQTVEAWMKTTNSGGKYLVSATDISSGIFTPGFLALRNNGAVAGGVTLSAMPDLDAANWQTLRLRATSAINDGVWHHVAFTVSYDPVGLQTTLTCYVDGVAESTRTPMADPNGEDQTFQPAGVVQKLNIGVNTWGSNYWDGSVDELRLYDKALSADEIMNNYKAGYGGAHQ